MIITRQLLIFIIKNLIIANKTITIILKTG